MDSKYTFSVPSLPIELYQWMKQYRANTNLSYRDMVVKALEQWRVTVTGAALPGRLDAPNNDNSVIKVSVNSEPECTCPEKFKLTGSHRQTGCPWMEWWNRQ